MDFSNNSEVKQKIHEIINESLENDSRRNYDGTEVFKISRYVTGLLSEKLTNPKLVSFLHNYDERIKRGGKEWIMFEEFGTGLAQFAKGNPSVKNVIKALNETMAQYSDRLDAYTTIGHINNDYVRDNVLESYNEYLADPCDETRTNINEAIENVYNIDENAFMRLNLIINESAKKNSDFFSDSLNESAQVELNRKIEENRKQKMANDIFAKVERYLDERQNSEAKKMQMINEKYSLAGIAGKNGLKLYERIKAVMKSDASRNRSLMNVLEQYSNALAHGAYEERLYETLLQNTQKFNYLLPVDKMRKSIMEVAKSKNEQISLTKLLEMMRDNASSYIFVDLIQEDVARYVHEPTPANRVQLRNALMPFANDPYISEMFNIIYNDDSLEANTLTEKAISIKEELDLIRQDTTVSNIYTPVQYIRENESIFNVHGQYYVKKGNSIAALDKKYISKLDERFVELCHLVNDPHVNILEDRIIVTGNDHYATIYEGYVEIDGCRESNESLRNLNEMYLKYQNYDTNFYIMCTCLLENFNNIAKIDWAKHISLNKNPEISADLFKLDENIYMATHNNAMMSHTFYRNVNALFCKNTLNEHMGINVASLFSDMLPDQDKIILKLNETKNEYESSIEEYEKMIEDLEDAKEEAKTEELQKQIDATIEDTKKKLEDVKNEYKDFQESTEEMIQDKDKDAEKEDDVEVTKETNNEPLDIEDVDDYRDELGRPLSAETDVTAEGDAEVSSIADEITDDEFSDYMATDASEETENPDDEDVIDTDVIDSTEPVDADDYGFEDETEDEGDVTDDEEFATVDFDDNSTASASETDDDIFDEEPESDDVANNVPEEDINNDEDILINDEDEEEPEEGDMTTIDAETGEEVGSEATDIFGGDVNNPIGDDEVITPELYNPNIQTEDFSILNVTFDSNVQDNSVYKSGEVLVIQPMIHADGSRFNDEKHFKFYLNPDNKPVINSDTDMSNAMYNAIINSIESHPQFDSICSNGIDVAGFDSDSVVSATDELEDTNNDNWEDEYKENGTPEDNGIYTVGDDEVNFNQSDDENVPDEIDTNAIDNVPAESPVAVPDADENTDTDFEITDVDVPETENAEETTDDNFDFSDIFGDLDVDSDETSDETPVETPAELPAETEAPVNDPVDTYTDIDGTEIEVPAPDANADEDADEDKDEDSDDEKKNDDETDNTVIPENYSRKPTKKQINENRKSIISIKKK